MAERTIVTLGDTLAALVEGKKYTTLRDILVTMNAVDVAAIFEDMPQDKLPLLFRLLPKELAAETFVEMDPETQELLIQGFSDNELKDVVDELYVDDAVDIVEEMPANVVKRILKQADPEMRKMINEILKYPDDSAGSIMTTEVFIDPEVLNTLSDEFFTDGMAEVIKYGCIKDKKFFDFLNSLDSKGKLMDNIEEIIYTCCNIKKLTVERDEKDKGERMLLNFGHTLGHAIEQYYNYSKYTHGVAVAIGMYEITKISEEKGFTKKGSAEKIKEILKKNKLPYEMDINMGEVIHSIELDKKNLGNDLNLILLKEIGNAEIVKSNKGYFEN